MSKSTKKITDLIGKEVRIYPGDTYKKTGVIQEVTDSGILFEITSYNGTDGQFAVGSLHFIAFSAKLSFQVIK